MKRFTLLAVFIIILFAAVLYTTRVAIPVTNVPGSGDEIDLTVIDIGNTAAILPLDWEYYPGGLFTHDEISSGAAGAPRQFDAKADERGQTLGTYRTVLHLPKAGLYAMTGYSLDYAMRVYVDGIETLSIGSVAESEDEFIPRVNYYTLPILAKTGRVELILQYANYVHVEGGAMRDLVLSTPEVIERYNQSQLMPINLSCGALLFLAIFYTVDFFLHRRRETVYFAASCFLLTIRNQRFYLGLVSYDYNWGFAYRLLFAGTILLVLAFALLGDSLYPGRFRKGAVRLLMGMTGTAIIAFIILPTRFTSGYINICLLCILPLILYFLVRLLGVLRGGGVQDRLAVFGLFVLLITAFFEMLLHRLLPTVARNGLMPAGMLAFAVCYMMMLRMRSEQATVQLTEEKRRTDFYRKMSHDMRTPLTRISTNIQIANMENETDHERLTKAQDEIMRLADMIDAALDDSGESGTDQ